MTDNIFISYSRREMGFVDDLVSDMEKQGFNVWLDYRSLVPGTPWKEQIEKGLNDSGTVLLVVSNASLVSEHVKLEWMHFIQANKRVMLAVFEGVTLPTELRNYEWADFRGGYQSGITELFQKLKQPLQSPKPIPALGFKAPPIVWVACLVSIACAWLSLKAWWTLFIPWILLPLPYRIIKRNYNYKQVQTALVMLPLAMFFQAALDQTIFSVILIFWSIFISPLLFMILHSSGLQRWGKPEATRPKFANPYQTENITPKPTTFYTDYSLQDQVAAQDLAAELKKFGHQQTNEINNASTAFVLISRYKSETIADPDKQIVFPVIIQTNDNMDKKLSSIQWIDFRPGVRKLDVIAKLLSNPSELLKALGIRPVSSQTIYPPTVTLMNFFLNFLGVFTIGSTIKYLQTSLILLLNLPFFSLIGTLFSFGIHIVIFSTLLFLMQQGITTRSGFFASFYRTALGFASMPFLLFWQLRISAQADAKLQAVGINILSSFAAAIPFVLCLLGVIALGFIFLWNYRDIKRWFPAKI